jgi:hypothetical protein
VRYVKHAGRWCGAVLIWLLAKAVGDVEIGPLTNDYYGEDEK